MIGPDEPDPPHRSDRSDPSDPSDPSDLSDPSDPSDRQDRPHRQDQPAGGRQGDGRAPWDDADADVTLDATGLRCPLPVIRLAAAARKLPEGRVIMLLSTDPAAGPDVAAWCRMRGHRLLTGQQHGPVLATRVRVCGTPSAEAPSAPTPGGAGTAPG